MVYADYDPLMSCETLQGTAGYISEGWRYSPRGATRSINRESNSELPYLSTREQFYEEINGVLLFDGTKKRKRNVTCKEFFEKFQRSGLVSLVI
jgi:hypothetical protein